MTAVLTNPMVWAVAGGVLALNLPFGFWRAGVPKFSRAWFLAVHLPVPCVVALRLTCRLGWHPVTVAVLVAAFFLGQLFGGLVRAAVTRARGWPGAGSTGDQV
jgi:hypothetical protein